MSPSPSIALVDYADLLSGGSSSTTQGAIASAFGEHPDCLGIILVRGVPGFQELRKRLLPMTNQLVRLPREELEKLEVKEASYVVGWSHGKEKFNGKFDTAKGSFYANPQFDSPSSDSSLIKEHSAYLSPNVWPQQLPELENAYKELGQLIIQVGKLVGRACDLFVHKLQPGYPEHFLENVISTTNCTKARLLHYFPRGNTEDEEGTKQDQDSWCGWHVDHCALTGLTSAMYTDENLAEVACPDPNAGLYIRSRGGAVHKAPIPADCLAFQMGEVSQIASGGQLRATYHCVRAAYGPKADHMARSTLAVFMQPTYDHKMSIPAGVDPKTIDVVAWKGPEQTFSDFTVEKNKEYY